MCCQDTFYFNLIHKLLDQNFSIVKILDMCLSKDRLAQCLCACPCSVKSFFVVHHAYGLCFACCILKHPKCCGCCVAGTSDREMVRRKEVYRRELEARRERRHLEKEKERTLMREIAKKRERSRSRERKKRRIEEEGDKTKASAERSK